MKSKKVRSVKGKKKSTAKTAVRPDKTAIASLDPLRTGMPALDSITGVKEFRKYRLIETNEVDEYEKPLSPKRKKK